MSRWEPNALGRLMEAALELYGDRGYDQTTVAEIAARAGLTERTFFRYFTDKREVLFFGSEELAGFITGELEKAPATASPLEAICRAMEAAGSAIEERRGHAGALKRHRVVMSHGELRERELIKLASLSSIVAEALRLRGVTEPAASLTAEAGIAVFKVGFERWVESDGTRSIAEHIREGSVELRAIALGQLGSGATSSSDGRPEPPAVQPRSPAPSEGATGVPRPRRGSRR